MPQVKQCVRTRSGTASLYDEFATARGLGAWLGDAQFKVNQQFGSVMLKLWDELDFAVTETRSPLTISWQCVTRRHPWSATRITFGFEVDAEACVLVSVSHTGCEEDANVAAATAAFWSRALESLKRLVESGSGSPVCGLRLS